jgi:hypothetical protein
MPESTTIRAAAALMSAEIVSAAEGHLALGSSPYALPGSAISLPFYPPLVLFSMIALLYN